MEYIPRLRRIQQVLKEIKEFDPDTELNWVQIKQLINQGLIMKMKIGDAWLINADELYSLFYKERKNESNDNN